MAHTLYAQPDYLKFIITVNAVDCETILGVLPSIKKLDSNISKEIIFSSSDRPDSAFLIENFYLADYKESIIFSDSLYHLFKGENPMQLSSVSLYNEDNDKYLQMPLTFIADNSEHFNNLLKDNDTINFGKDFFTRSSSYTNSTNYHYHTARQKGEISAFHKLNPDDTKEFSITDSIATASYIARYGKKDGKKKQDYILNYFKEKEFISPKPIIRSYQVNEDTMYLFLQTPSLLIRSFDGDTIASYFYTLCTFKDTELIDITYLDDNRVQENWEEVEQPGLKRNIIEDKYDDSYFMGNKFIKKGSDLYIYIRGNFIAIGAENQALAKYKNLNDGHINKYDFEAYERELPSYYRDIDAKIGYNYVFHHTYIPYFDPYFSFHLGDTLYSLDKTYDDIPLDFIPTHANRDKLVFVEDFKIVGNYLYVLIYDDTEFETIQWYYKYNLCEKKVEREFQILDKVSLRIDSFDYNYLCAFGQDIADKFVRIKAF